MLQKLTRGRRVGALVGVTVAALALAGCSGSDSATENSNGLPTIRVSGLNDPGGLPAIVMEEMAIDEKHGFNIDFTLTDLDAEATTFLMGETDISSGDAVSAAIANSQGHNVAAFFPMMSNTASIVVPAGSAITTPADLVGKKVGHFGSDSGTTQAITLTLKEGFGVDVNSLNLVQSAPASLPELLAKGEIDAIFDYEPYSGRAVEQTGGKYLLQVTPHWKKAADWAPPLAMMLAKQDWLKQNPELAQKFVAAWQEASQAVIDSKYQLFHEQPYAEFLDVASDQELTQLAEYCDALPCYENTWTQSDVDNQMSFLQLMVDAGMLTEMPADVPVVTLDRSDS